MKNIHRILAITLCVLVGVLVCTHLFAQTPPKDVIILKGAPMGGVRFDHKLHNQKCDTCHHPSKSEKPAKAAQEACTDCHTTTATPPMKTKKQAAFHNPTATAGVCIDCHKKEVAAGKKTPAKCNDCHKKENV